MGLTDVFPTGSLQQRISEFQVPPGSLLTAQNCRHNQSGALSKRPGNAILSNQYQQPNGLGATSIDVSLGGALSAHGNQLLLTNKLGITAYSPSFGTFNVPQPTSEASLRRTGVTIPQLIQGNQTTVSFLMPPAVCTDGTRYFYCWVSSGGACFVTIEDISTGDIVQDQVQPFPGATNIVWAVPFMVGTQFTVVALTSASHIAMAGWAAPYTSILPTVSATLVTTATITCMIDAIAIDASHFVVGWANGGTVIHLDEFTSAGAVAGNASTIGTANPLDIRLSLVGGTIWLGISSSTPTLKLCAYNSTTLAVTLTSFSVLASTIYSFAVLGLSGTQCAVAYTYSSGGNDATQCDVVDRTLAAGSGGFTLQAANTSYSCALASKPFSQGGKTYVWLQVYSDSGGSQNASLYGIAQLNQTQWTYVLCDTLVDSAQTGFPHPMRPLGVDSPRFAFAVSNRSVTNTGSAVAPLDVVSPAANQWVTIFGTRATAYVSNWNRVIADFASPARWKSVELNGALLQSSGMVCVWDGQRAFENGFVHHVCKPQFSVTVGGFLTASAAYYYKAVPIQTDGAGNVHQGIPSILATTSTTGTNKTIALILPPVSLTLRAPYPSSATTIKYPIYYEIFRSQPNPGSTGTDVATTYLDVAVATSNGFITYTDAGAVSDASVAGNAGCYTFGGAEPNGCPPGSLDIAAHRGRAWILADDGQTLYFSKAVVQGEAVNFTDGFTLSLDTADGVSLKSLDDKLVALGTTHLYYLDGNAGPADNGTQTDFNGFFSIQSSVGCTEPRSVVSADPGIFFRSQIGIHLLDRGLSVSYIGQPIAGELAAFPVVTSAVLHPTQPWIYFTVTNAAGNAGERLVYDYRVEKWYVDTLPGVPISAVACGGVYYWLDTSGNVWAEDAAGTNYKDNGSWITMKFETAWNRLANLMGYMSLDRFQVLATKIAPCDVAVSLRENYKPAASQTILYFDPASQSQTKLPNVEIEFSNNPGKQESFTVIYSDAPPSGGASTSGAGWTVHGLTYQAKVIDENLNRLPPAQRGVPAS